MKPQRLGLRPQVEASGLKLRPQLAGGLIFYSLPFADAKE